jgi:hypothetical protein
VINHILSKDGLEKFFSEADNAIQRKPEKLGLNWMTIQQ